MPHPGLQASAVPVRVFVGHVPVDSVQYATVWSRLEALIASGLGGTVFTPNADHVVRAESDTAFRRVYARCVLALPDGMPVVWSAKLLGERACERITGVDMFVPLLAQAEQKGWRVYVVGGRVGASEKLQELVAARFPTLAMVGYGPPTQSVLANPALLDAEVDAIREARPHLVLVCLGSPLQELWSDDVAARVAPSLLFGLGSAMDVVVGMQSRAPVWMQNAGFEWLYRLGSDPRRLWRRYLVDDTRFAGIMLRTLARKSRRA